MSIQHTMLFLIEVMLIGLAAYVAAAVFRAVFRRLDDPRGFFLRLPKGVIIYGVTTCEREVTVGSDIRALARNKGFSASDRQLQEAA